ncbi:MAG: chemotaxis protein CheA [Methanomicrobiales archaeon]|nr:chemotaxis protein CheA [Methanomicrobiales archaeon]
MSEEDSYQQIFIVESRENHEMLVRNLLALEGGGNAEAIDEIFRAAHTLKGMSASMGYPALERLCHAMEDKFHLIRDRSLAVQPELIDMLLCCTDRIEELLDQIERGDASSLQDPADLLTALEGWSSSRGDSLSQPENQPSPDLMVEPEATPSPETHAYQLYRVLIRTADDCSMKDLRAMLALENLEELGKIISTNPERDDIENGRFLREFTVVMESSAGCDALQMAASGVDIAAVIVSEETSGEPEKAEGTLSTSPAKAEKSKEVKNIRVDIGRLDQMMNLVEDLVINRGRLKQIAARNGIKELDDAINLVGRSISDLQNLMMNIRMIPLAHIFNRFPRVVRDVAHHDGKVVEFIIEGGETELDRSIMDGLSDPLLHLIRNAVNHGIELPDVRIAKGKTPNGIVTLTACRDRDNVLIEIRDDGSGIDEEVVRKKAVEKGVISPEQEASLSQDEIIQLLFRPGFSTAETITDISGRGVGLDVVKRGIEALKGLIQVESVKGEGTTFRLVLPPTMAIVEVMMVRINGRRCAVPITNVVEVAVLRPESIRRIGGSEVLLLRDEVLSLRRLEDMFGTSDGRDLVIVVQHQNKKAGLAIDAVDGQQEVVIKPLNNLFGSCRGIGGVTIPGDGEVVSVLDISTLL